MSRQPTGRAAISSSSRVHRSTVTSCGAMQLVPRVTLSEANAYLIGGRVLKRIPFTATLTPGGFTGRVVLTWDVSQVRVFTANTGGRELGSGNDLASTYWKNQTSLYAEPVAASSAALTLSVPAPGEGNTVDATNAAATLTIEAIDLSVKADDGASAAPATVLMPNTRRFKAVLTVTGKGETYRWTKSGGSTLFTHASAREMVTVTPQVAGAAELTVTAKIFGKEIAVKHAFTVVTAAIREGGGVKDPPPKLIRAVKQDYKAVTTPSDAGGTFAWTVEGGRLATGASTTSAVVEVTGNTAGDAQKLKLAYTLNGQTANVEHAIAVTEIALVKKVVAVQLDRTNGSVVTLQSNAPANAGHSWAITANGTEAEADGATTEAALKVKGKKVGVAGATLTYTASQAAQTLRGAAVFADCWLKSFTPENRTKVDLTTSSAATDKKATVLLGITNDPPAWKVGALLLEAEGAPADFDTCDVQATGTYVWKASTHVVAAAAQPSTSHGADKAAILMRARPASNGTGPTDATDQDVEVTYTLHGLEVKDKIVVTIRTAGCSCVKWRRKGTSGGGQVTVADRPLACGHGTTPQRSAFTDTVPPSGGISAIASGGHQHGGRCLRCSLEGDQQPRTVWHYADLTTAVLAEARALAGAIYTFASGRPWNAAYRSTAGENKNLLTAALKRYLRGPNVNQRNSKMVGVLRGTDGHGRAKWLFALSGNWWSSDGDWCATLDENWADDDTERTIPSYSGSATIYKKTAGVFNVSAMTSGFGKFGLCAAPKLLKKAAADGLMDCALAEVWLDMNSPQARAGRDPQEIASCEQCRRFLGRMLCEVAT